MLSNRLPPAGADGERWDDVAARHLLHAGHGRWRRYCDGLYAALIEEWAGGARVSRALKTDLFDEAVGDGLVDTLHGLSDEVHGVDISPVIAEAAKARHSAIDARVDDVRRSGYPDEHFDLVVSNSTLDHFATREELERSLAEIYRLLAPGGRLVISLDNLANPVIALRQILPFGLLHRLGLCPFVVGETLGPSGLRSALIQAGFDVREERVVMHAPRVLAVLLCRALDRVSSRPASADSRLVSALWRADVMAGWPTRNLTGYYVAALAWKPARG